MGNSKTERIYGSDHEPLNAPDVIAIITARGGSKGIPRKNLKLLNGKPLIVYSIQAALNCPFIKSCIVSTEDDEIKQISLEAGAEVIDRPDYLATDTALSKDVVRHVLETLQLNGKLPDYFALLQPTSPLRTAGHLTSCIERFLSSTALSSISVTEAEHHPYKTFLLDDSMLKPLIDSDSLEWPRQMLPVIYRQNGAIYLTSSKLFLEQNNLFIEPILPYYMSGEESLDIDSLIDLRFAEALLQSK